ncbi:MAG: GerMN domain-containing protein [Treponema sp.]|nr:GerMN domain-containing protein [Treponema sp.]
MSFRDMSLGDIFSRLRRPKARLCAFVLLAGVTVGLAVAALAEFHVSGLARRTFVFYAIGSGDITVEERMLRRAESRERDVARYVEEALLGPVAQDLLPLFPRGTRLESLLYRDGVVFADFSGDAAMPPAEGGEVFGNFETLRAGITRNFPGVEEVRFFIDGRPAFRR